VAQQRCTGDPPLDEFESGHLSRCWRAGEIATGTLAANPDLEVPRG
jgi:hypothetical protein